jgi:hypothetical protein
LISEATSTFPNFAYASSTYLYYNSSGNVGIGTTTPGSTLTIVGSSTPRITPFVSESSSDASSWFSVTYGNGQFVAISPVGTHEVMTSPDGINWTNQNGSGNGGWVYITYGNGIYVAIAQGGSHRIMTSPNGINWTARNSPESNSWSSITYGNGQFVAVSINGTHQVMTSTDGINWVSQSAAKNSQWLGVTYGNGKFVAIAQYDTDGVMYSSDGINWATSTIPEGNVWQSITYGNGKFVAVAGSGTHRVMTSTDGINWIAQNAAEQNTWYSVTYGDGLFVAVSQDGTNRIMSSPDGINWTSIPAPEQNSWVSVIYGSRVFVAVSYDGSHKVMMSTPNQTLSVIGDSYFNGNLASVNLSGTNSGDVVLTNNANGLTLSGQALTMTLSSSTATGTLSALDWTTFNNKLATTTAFNTYTTLGNNDNLSYRYNTDPLLYWTNTEPKVLKTISVPGSANYGTWDGKYFWSSNFFADSISKINENGQILATYSLPGVSPIQLAYDGKYIWVASGDPSGHLIKFDPVSGTVVGNYPMNSVPGVDGGIQGIVWDGTNIWIGVAQSTTTAGYGFVAKINPDDGSVEATALNQTNVNGLAITDIKESSGTVRYIWAACEGFISKIKASDMSYQSFPSGSGTYRIATDGKYIYGASYFDNAVYKFSINDGSIVSTWPSGDHLNTIAFDGKYIWTAGDGYFSTSPVWQGPIGNQGITIHDRDTGAIVYSLPGDGQSDLVFDGTYMWSVIAYTQQIKKISIGNQIGNLKIANNSSIMDVNGDTSIFLDGTSTGSSFILSNLGIGTTTPSTNLQVQGGLRLTGNFFDSTNATGTEGMVLQSTGTSTLWTVNPSPTFEYASSSYLLYSSSTEVLNAANFVPVFVPGAITYDENTLAAYNFENNLNDSAGSYNLVATGTGPVYQTDLVKQGTYSESVQVSTNYSTFPTSLMTTLGAASAWTIEGWVYLEATREPDVWSTFISNSWAATSGILDVMPRTDSPEVCFGYDTSGISCDDTTITTNAWHFLSVQWDGSYAKLYVDGALQATVNSSVNIFTSPIGPMIIGNGTTYPNSYNIGSRIDKLIVSGTVRNGIETNPTISGYFTPKIFANASGTLFAKNATGAVSDLNAWTTKGTNISYLLGNVGIGTDNPSSALTVIGSTTISTLSSGFVKSTALGELYTDPNTYSTFGQSDLLSYRYNTNPLLYWSDNGSHKIVKTVNVPSAANYGAWDGENFWTTNFNGNSITKINESGKVLATYKLGSLNPLQAVYDGRNIWVASADCNAHLVRFDTVTATTTGDYIMNPSCTGSGGLQSVLWDGKNIWVGIAGINTVAKIDPTTGAVIASTTGQTNVNGMAITDIGGVEYIWAANYYSLGKIKASDLTYTNYNARSTDYRIATDGTYIYDADWQSGKIDKYLAADGSMVATWQAETGLNTIAFDGKYIWVSGGGNHTVQIFDRDTGAIVDSIDNAGKADLVFDGSYMWSVDNDSGNVYKISIGNQIGNLKIAQSLSIMDDNANTSLFLSGTSSENSFMLSNLGIGTTTSSSALTVIGTTTISSLTAGLVGATADGSLYTVSATNTYLGLNSIGAVGYDNLNPLINFSTLANTQVVMSTTTVSNATDYGAWDGKHLWVSQFDLNSITEISEDNKIINTFTLANNINPIQMVYDGRYIWVASADEYGHLVKFDPVSGTTVGTYTINPTGLGAGGLQSVIWDGSNIWVGVAQEGGGINSGFVAKIDPTTGAVIASTTGQTNVNGLAFSDIDGVRYIYSACNAFIGKIKASDMTYATSALSSIGTTYRIVSDGNYIYGASWANKNVYSTVQKYDARTLTLVNAWSSDSWLNTIAFDGKYIWVAGDASKISDGNPDSSNEGNITIHDRDTGAIVKTLVGAGRSDLIFDGTYMWSISRTTGAIRKISIGNTLSNVKYYDSLSILSTGATSTLIYLKASTTGSSYIMSKLGIGTTTPSATLTISGTPTSTLLRLVGFGNGTLTSDNLGNVTESSDERLKNISSNFTRSLTAIEGLIPINYYWNATSGLDTAGQYTGFSAQNVQANIPEAVGTSSNGYLTLSDRPIIAALVNAVKEIGSFITKVENGIAYLTNIVVDKLTVGSEVSPSGITMYDRTTKQPYCVFMDNGIWSSEQGKCSGDSEISTTDSSSTSSVVTVPVVSASSSATDVLSASSSELASTTDNGLTSTTTIITGEADTTDNGLTSTTTIITGEADTTDSVSTTTVDNSQTYLAPSDDSSAASSTGL